MLNKTTKPHKLNLWSKTISSQQATTPEQQLNSISMSWNKLRMVLKTKKMPTGMSMETTGIMVQNMAVKGTVKRLRRLMRSKMMKTWTTGPIGLTRWTSLTLLLAALILKNFFLQPLKLWVLLWTLMPLLKKKTSFSMRSLIKSTSLSLLSLKTTRIRMLPARNLKMISVILRILKPIWLD